MINRTPLPQSRLTPCQPPRQRGPREGAFFGASSSEGAETPRTDVDFSVRLMKADSLNGNLAYERTFDQGCHCETSAHTGCGNPYP